MICANCQSVVAVVVDLEVRVDGRALDGVALEVEVAQVVAVRLRQQVVGVGA